MTVSRNLRILLDSERLLTAYTEGAFPMASFADEGDVDFYRPEMRAMLPIEDLHISRSLKKAVRRGGYEIVVDGDFDAVIGACAAPAPGREETWINAPIRRAFNALFQRGDAHCLSVHQGGAMTGGLYGVALGSTFCGESMFSRADNASKIALVHLCARLWRAGFRMLDAQFKNPHLMQFGLYEIPSAQYARKLQDGLRDHPDFQLKRDRLGEDEKALVAAYLANRSMISAAGSCPLSPS